MSPQNFEAKFLGQVGYQEALSLQEQRLSALALSKSTESSSDIGTVFGLEHPAVITLGRRSSIDHDLKIPESQLKAQGFEIIWVGRGGHATMHSPGQLLIYPVVRLDLLGLGVRAFVELLETVTIQTFAKWIPEVKISKAAEPGLYTPTGKIAFFGLQIQNQISFHGISINVINDLSLFNGIRSCGVHNERFDQVCNHLTEAQLLDRVMPAGFQGPLFPLTEMSRFQVLNRFFDDWVQEFRARTGSRVSF